MKRSNAQIYQTELLLTLDYLLNYTDEDHPATGQDICRHANDFGLKYDSNAKSGNDVRRQRISDCLKFLMEVTSKFPEEAPFILQQNDSGKYYIEQKNYLSEEQIIKILAAVKNDRYTQSEDTDFLIERLLDSLSNKHNREYFKIQLEKENKGVRKYKASVNKKMKLVNKAYMEGKCLLIVRRAFGPLNPEDRMRIGNNSNAHQRRFDTYDEKIICRVYKIKEYNNKPYVILLPLNAHGVKFDTIENLNIPINLQEKELVFDDLNENRDLNELFKSNNPTLAKYYESLDDYVEKQIMPESGFAFKTSFYFFYRHLDRVKRSFEEYFCIEMPFIKCSKFTVDKEQVSRGGAFEMPYMFKKYAVECEPLSEKARPTYAVVNIEINKEALLTWLWNNPDVANLINVVSPYSINEQLGTRALRLLLKYREALGDENIENALRRNRLFDREFRYPRIKKRQEEYERKMREKYDKNK